MKKRSLPVLFVAPLFVLPVSGLRAAPGDLLALRADAFGSQGSSVYVAVPQVNGRILVGGWFQTLGGVSRLNLAQVFTTGQSDPSFAPSTTGSAPAVRSIAVLPDGRMLIAGEFSSVNSQARGRGAILNTDGTVVAGFDPGLNEYVYCTVVQPDGKVLFGGNFTSAFGVARSRIVRLNGNLSLDTAFNPVVNNTVRVMMEQPDGKLILGGNFTVIGGSVRNRIARLNVDGTVDASFNPNVNGPVYTATMLADGKILAGGSFTSVGGVSRQNLVRLHPDGSVDTSYTAGADGIVRSLAPQVDGKVIVGGEFSVIGGVSRNRFARLNADGSANSAFTLGANGTVFSVVLKQDGNVLLGGGFSKVGTADRINLAGLANDSTFQFLAVPSPGRIQWVRLGAMPEARYATFDYSSSLTGPWTRLGVGTRTINGWEMTGMVLPKGGYIRGQARIYSSYSGGSSYLHEDVTSFTFTFLQVWRQTHFGTPDDTGDAANLADPDHDGLTNAVEFAFGLNPRTPDVNLLPEWEIDGGETAMLFTAPESADGTVYRAEYNTTLANTGWQPIANQGLGREHFFVVPQIPGSRMFLRLRVIVP
jgi:uncharacterized delta-60 repeat protein